MPARKTSTARKTSKLPTRIWKFSARFVSGDDKKLATELLYTSGRYYNKLVEIDQARMDRFRAIRARYAPELAEKDDAWMKLDDQIAEIYRSTKDLRQRHFRDNDDEKVRLLPPEFQVRVDALKVEQKKLAEVLKKLRADFRAILKPANDEYNRRSKERCDGAGPRVKSKVNDEVRSEMLLEDAWSPIWKEIAVSDDEAHCQAIEARAQSKLPSGTYLKVDEAFKQAKKVCLERGRAPGFHRLKPSGRLTVQLGKKTIKKQKVDTTYADLIAGMPSISIKPAPLHPTKKQGKNPMMLVRIDQSIPRGKEQSISATIKMHRQPPSDALVKWASFCVRKVGRQTTVELQLTMEHASFSESKRPVGVRAPDHIQIGWAHTKTGTRIAHWSGGEVVLPSSILAQHEHACAITGVSDSLFDEAKKLIRRSLRRMYPELSWPQFHSDRARSIMRRACFNYAEHVLGVVRAQEMWRLWVDKRLRCPRPPGHLGHHRDLFVLPNKLRNILHLDAQTAFAFWLFLWAKKDAHLSQYAVNSAKRFEHRRDAFFRTEAIRIATEFSGVTVDNYNIAVLKKLDPITMPGETPRDRAQHQLHEAAPGRFREILREVMGGRCTPCERPGGDKNLEGARGSEAQNEGKEGDEEMLEDLLEVREGDEEAAE